MWLLKTGLVDLYILLDRECVWLKKVQYACEREEIMKSKIGFSLLLVSSCFLTPATAQRK